MTFEPFHHGGNRLAHVTNFVHRQAWMIGDFQPFHPRGARHEAELALNVPPRVNGHHSGRRFGSGRIHFGEARVGMNAPHKGHVEHPIELDVVHVMASPLNEPGIFFALNSFAEKFGSHNLPRK